MTSLVNNNNDKAGGGAGEVNLTNPPRIFQMVIAITVGALAACK